MRLIREFVRFHRANPEVYKIFKRFTFEAIEAGRERFSARTIWHRIRWYTDVETTDPQYKLNNNHSPYYARMFMKDFPLHRGFFKTRTVQKELV